MPHLHRDWAHPMPHLHRDWSHPMPHLHRDWAHPVPHLHRGLGPRLRAGLGHLRCSSARTLHICTRLRPARSASVRRGLGQPQPICSWDCSQRCQLLPHPRRKWAFTCHVCAWAGLTPATSRQKWARYRFICTGDWAHPSPHPHLDCADSSHVCIGIGTASATVGRRLRLCDCAHPCPHLHRDWAHPAHICTVTGLAPATSGPGLGPPLSYICTSLWHRLARCAPLCGE